MTNNSHFNGTMQCMPRIKLIESLFILLLRACAFSKIEILYSIGSLQIFTYKISNVFGRNIFRFCAANRQCSSRVPWFWLKISSKLRHGLNKNYIGLNANHSCTTDPNFKFICVTVVSAWPTESRIAENFLESCCCGLLPFFSLEIFFSF